MALGGAHTPHLDRAGNENQDRDDTATNEAVATLPTVNVYYKYPLQKNDLSREVILNLDIHEYIFVLMSLIPIFLRSETLRASWLSVLD